MSLDDFSTDDSIKQEKETIETLREFLRNQGYITTSAIERSPDQPSVATVKRRLNVDTWEGVLERIGYWEINKWKPDKEWNPTAQNQQLLHVAFALLANQTEERTKRDVYYGLDSRGYDYGYTTVQNALTEGTKHGWLNPDWLIDSSRLPIEGYRSGYSDPLHFVQKRIDGIHLSYFEDWWAEMDDYVEVWLEKASLQPVFKPICDEYNVRLDVMGGNQSHSRIHRAISDRLMPELLNEKDITILYFGDLNPSGLHAPVAIQNTMRHYGIDMKRDGVGTEDCQYYDISSEGRITPEISKPRRFLQLEGDKDIDDLTEQELELSVSCGLDLGTIKFDRIALTPEQYRDEFPELPTTPPPEQSDKSEDEIDLWERCLTIPPVDIELNALKEFHREKLEQMIADAITDHLDEEHRETVEQRIEKRKQMIQEAVSVDKEELKISDPDE